VTSGTRNKNKNKKKKLIFDVVLNYCRIGVVVWVIEEDRHPKIDVLTIDIDY